MFVLFVYLFIYLFVCFIYSFIDSFILWSIQVNEATKSLLSQHSVILYDGGLK